MNEQRIKKMDKKRPTNADIYQELGEIKQIALATKEQAERTNGRVSKLENWQNAIIAVENYQEKHPAYSPVKQWFEDKDIKRLITGLAILTTAIVAYLAFLQGAR